MMNLLGRREEERFSFLGIWFLFSQVPHPRVGRGKREAHRDKKGCSSFFFLLYIFCCRFGFFFQVPYKHILWFGCLPPSPSLPPSLACSFIFNICFLSPHLKMNRSTGIRLPTLNQNSHVLYQASLDPGSTPWLIQNLKPHGFAPNPICRQSYLCFVLFYSNFLNLIFSSLVVTCRYLILHLQKDG